jgi:hypothetical protein
MIGRRPAEIDPEIDEPLRLGKTSVAPPRRSAGGQDGRPLAPANKLGT